MKNILIMLSFPIAFAIGWFLPDMLMNTGNTLGETSEKLVAYRELDKLAEWTTAEFRLCKDSLTCVSDMDSAFYFIGKMRSLQGQMRFIIQRTEELDK